MSYVNTLSGTKIVYPNTRTLTSLLLNHLICYRLSTSVGKIDLNLGFVKLEVTYSDNIDALKNRLFQISIQWIIFIENNITFIN